MVKESNMCYGIEELKNIPICDLLKIEVGSKYVLIAIDHYSKWCEVKLVKEQGKCKLGWFKNGKNPSSKSPYFNIKMEKKFKNQC